MYVFVKLGNPSSITKTHTNTLPTPPSSFPLFSHWQAAGLSLPLQNIPHQVTPWQHAQPHPLASQRSQHFQLQPPRERDTHDKREVRDGVNQWQKEEREKIEKGNKEI